MLLSKLHEISITNRNITLCKTVLGNIIKVGKYNITSLQSIQIKSSKIRLDVVCERCNKMYHPIANLANGRTDILIYCSDCRNESNRMNNINKYNNNVTKEQRSEYSKSSWSGDKGRKRSIDYKDKWIKNFKSKPIEEQNRIIESNINKLPHPLGDKHPNWNPNKSEYSDYKSLVYMETRKHQHIFEQWDNYELRGLCGVSGAYQLDHIIPIKYGFDNNICSSIIGELNNLQLIPWKQNRTKGYKI